jgi:hypothetical protein
MCLLSSTNWVFISQKTTFFIVTAVNTSNLTRLIHFGQTESSSCNLQNAQAGVTSPRPLRDSEPPLNFMQPEGFYSVHEYLPRNVILSHMNVELSTKS